MSSTIDLDAIAKNDKLTISVASIQEEAPKDASLRRIKEFALFITALIFVIIAFFFCGYIFLNEQSTADDKKWSMVIASGIISALLGFLTGKKVG